MSKLPQVSIPELLDAGIHFGHKTSRWNPKMAPYIYGERDKIHIINLQQTAALIPIALNAIYETAKNNGKILFVSTKVQASSIIAEYAEKCGQYYVNHRWLGGMLTNWGTVSKSLKTLAEIENTLASEEIAETYTKKEILEFNRKKEKLLRSLGGIKQMGSKPDLIIVIDTNKEHLAIEEALKLSIPIVGVVDSNSDPDAIDYPIPGNDDAIRSIKLYCSLFADAVLKGIEDSLIASGVDIGESKEANMDDSSGGVVTKMKESNKVAKTAPAKKVEKDAKVVSKKPLAEKSK